MTKKRWEEVAACQHEWSDYEDSGNCATPYCTWTEYRCKKCGIYSRSCGCGFEAGLSGEPRKREMKRERKRYNQLRNQLTQQGLDKQLRTS